MKPGYVSVLHKNTLLYNLLHHITEAFKLNDKDRKKAETIISNILTNFEHTEAKTK